MPKDQHGEMLSPERSRLLTKVFLFTKTTLPALRSLHRGQIWCSWIPAGPCDLICAFAVRLSSICLFFVHLFERVESLNKISSNSLPSHVFCTTGVKASRHLAALLKWRNVSLLGRDPMMSISAPPCTLQHSKMCSVQDDTMSLSGRQPASDALFAPYKELASLFNGHARALSQSSSVPRRY